MLAGHFFFALNAHFFHLILSTMFHTYLKVKTSNKKYSLKYESIYPFRKFQENA